MVDRTGVSLRGLIIPQHIDEVGIAGTGEAAVKTRDMTDRSF